MKKLLAALVLTFGVLPLASAGLLVEPYLGYHTGDLKFTYESSLPVVGGTDGSAKVTGTELGLRIGYKFLLPWVAFDYTMGSGSISPDFGSSSDYTSTEMGVTAGVNLPLLRPYGGYGFDGKLTNKLATGNADFTGTYLKLGVGLGLVPFVHVNLEYKMNQIDKISGQDYSSVYSSLKYDNFMLGVSAPFYW